MQALSAAQRNIAAILFSFIAIPVLWAQQPEALQFNVPYHCPDGTDNIITKCNSNARGTVCFWREEKNGQLIVERFNIRSQMDGWLKICKVQSAQSSPSGQRQGGAQTPQQAAQPPQPGQAMNPPYLVEFPSVERVKREIQGNSPDDTLARQVAVLTYLPFILTRMQDPNRSVRAPLTPDEQRISGAYALAAYEMSQAYAKTHSPAQAQEFERLHGRYEMDRKFDDDWFNRLFSPEFRAAYENVQAGKNAHYQAHVAQEQRDYERDRALQVAADQQAATGQPPGMRNDKGTQEVRRCVELGGNELECIGKGMKTGFFDLLGVDPKSILPAGPVGLRMTGAYKGESSVELAFREESVGMVGCGQLVAASHNYTVGKNGNQLLVKVENEPRPFVLALGPDGRFAGPGPIDIKGQIIVGYRKYWVEQRRVSDNTIIPGSGHEETEPIYAPKTERCTLAGLRPTGSTSSAGSLLAALFTQQGAREYEKKATPPGPRLAGEYAGPSGFKIEFHTDEAVMDCGQAHVSQPYSVENTPNQVLVTVKNGASPVALALQPNGALVGSGTVDVAGRVVSGTTNDAITYAARNARCPLGTLVVNSGGGGQGGGGLLGGLFGSGGSAADAPADSNPSPVKAQPSNPAPANPRANTASVSPSAGGSMLSVAGEFPGGANPLGGKMVFLMKDRFDNILRKLGMPVPADVTPGRAWVGFAMHCRPPADCRALLLALNPYYVGRVQLENTGKGTFPQGVAAGTYYVLGTANNNNHVLVWDVKVDLKSGANSVVLDQRNAEAMN